MEPCTYVLLGDVGGGGSGGGGIEKGPLLHVARSASKVPPILTNDNRHNTAFYKLSLIAVAMYDWLTLKSPCKIESMLFDRC